MSWLDAIGELTREHRERRAESISRRGKRRKWQLRADLWSENYVRDALRWYEDRARGQRERIARVSDCGADVLRVTCGGCGKSQERPIGCRIGILCVRCRGAIAQRKRAIFRQARADVLEQAQRRGLLSPYRPKGRYSEKFLTLTAPHVRGEPVGRRIERVFDAWPLFLKQLNTYFREHRATSAEWFRVFEWTIGDDGHGHPHIHLWLFCNYLPFEDLGEWWTAALLSGGCPADAFYRDPTSGDRSAIVHIKEVDEADGGARELIKYLTKDITSNGDKIPPELYAEVYKALDGRRVTQASRGFMARADGAAHRCECGADLPKKVEKLARPAAPQAETPDP